MPMPEALGEVDRFPYVLKSNRDDPVEEQVTFTLMGLKDRERTQARNALLTTSAAGNETMDALDLTVALGLKGWTDNFQRKNKADVLEPVKWPGTGRKALKHLGEIIVQELAMEIMKASEIGEHEKGN